MTTGGITVSIAVTVSGIYILLVLDAYLSEQPAVNAIVITWVTVLDNRHASAVARALGATAREVTVALATAQVLPALLGAVLGVFPGGYLLFAAIMAITDGDSDRATLPVPWRLVALVLATVPAVAALTAVPAHLGGRRPVTQSL